MAAYEARLAHLALAHEIAGALLGSQQAEAIVAASSLAVRAAVSMTYSVLLDLAEGAVVQLEEDRRAVKVCDLVLALCV